MKNKKRKAFVLVEIIVGFALIGLLASVVFPSITATKVGMSKVEKKTTVIDQAQRITQTLKAPSQVNNDLLNHLIEGDLIDYKDSLLTDDLIASIFINSVSENYQMYTVEVKYMGEDIGAKFQATRNFK